MDNGFLGTDARRYVEDPRLGTGDSFPWGNLRCHKKHGKQLSGDYVLVVSVGSVVECKIWVE
jgi:hypothetical protein